MSAVPPVENHQVQPTENSLADFGQKKGKVFPIPPQLGSARVATAKDRERLGGAMKGDMRTIKVLGEGAFGIVDLVLVAVDGRHLLCVRKKLLKRSGTNKNDPAKEVEFLEACVGGEFVMQLWASVVGLYDYTLLLEYCPYGSLEKLLNVVSEVRSRTSSACWNCLSDRVLRMERRAGLSEDEARFYTGCVVLGLEFMHGKGMLHRDLKPANLMIAENRYMRIGDLGLCKWLAEGERANSSAGTPGYMAPEIVHAAKTSGYSYPADLWSLGMVIWEMVDGVLPKWAAMSWYWTNLHFPEHFSPDLRELLSGLLHKDPKKRPGLADLRTCAWLRRLDWQGLAAQTLEAPNPPELADVHIHAELAKASGNASQL